MRRRETLREKKKDGKCMLQWEQSQTWGLFTHERMNAINKIKRDSMSSGRGYKCLSQFRRCRKAAVCIWSHLNLRSAIFLTWTTWNGIIVHLMCSVFKQTHWELRICTAFKWEVLLFGCYRCFVSSDKLIVVWSSKNGTQAKRLVSSRVEQCDQWKYAAHASGDWKHDLNRSKTDAMSVFLYGGDGLWFSFNTGSREQQPYSMRRLKMYFLTPVNVTT